MSSRMKRNLHALKKLSKASKHTRYFILDNASRDLILALDEAIHNVMLGTVELNDVEFKKLKKKKKLLEQVWDADAPLKKKKRLLKQKGAGLLGTLLPPALALLSTLLYKRNA